MRNLFLISAFLFLFGFGSCKTSDPISENEVAEFIDQWHKAAADADLKSYFRMMSDDAIYIGTDPTERWTKKEFFQFCEPHFLKRKTWNFKPFNRQIYFSKNKEIIWFDELLETWMGVCRGSGVIVQENGMLKISHYHLSVTIKNETIKEFLQINQN